MVLILDCRRLTLFFFVSRKTRDHSDRERDHSTPRESKFSEFIDNDKWDTHLKRLDQESKFGGRVGSFASPTTRAGCNVRAL
jgi:hypothetical protein